MQPRVLHKGKPYMNCRVLERQSITDLFSDFYTLVQATDALGVSTVTLCRWSKAGKLQGHPVGREVLYEKDVLDEMCGQTTKTSATYGSRNRNQRRQATQRPI